MQKSGKKNYMTVTATQKEILKAFNMTAANIRTQAAAMNEDLMQIEKEG